MRKYICVVAAALTAALSVGIATATAAKGGNSENAHLCQKGGWMNLQGSDGTQFANQDECVSFGAHGGTIVPKPPCTAGSDNFSDDAEFSQPTTFNGGTIDGPYASSGGIYIQGSSWFGNFPDGTHVMFTGESGNPFRLTFTTAVNSVQLDATVNAGVGSLTLTGYDSSDSVVDTDVIPSVDGFTIYTMSVSSATNNIKYFTIQSSDSAGLGFTNIVWACA
jgi:hypothetical protein